MLIYGRPFRLFGTVRSALCVLIGCLCVAGLARLAVAQEPPSYTWDTVGEDYADRIKVNTKEAEKNSIIMGRGAAGGSLVALDNWYTQYLFPSMAVAENFGDMAQKRLSLATDLERTTEPNLHQHLVDLAYNEAVKRVTGNYHPFVRYNAMLIIGNLNQTEKVNLGGVIYPPVRLPRALDFLIDQLREPDQDLEIQVGALIGIWRHLNLVRVRPSDQPIPEARRAEIASLARTILEEKTASEDASSSQHTWLRRRAADVLSVLGEVGANRENFDSLVRVVADAEEPLSLRCTAAEALGNLVYTDVTGIDAVATARQLGALAAFACRTEDKRAKDEQKALEEELMRTVRGGYGGMPGSGLGGYTGPATGSSGGPRRRPGSAGAGSGSASGAGMSMPGSLGGEGSTMPGGSFFGSGSGYGMGRAFGAGGDSDEMKELIEQTRRRLKYPLACTLQGVRGTEQKTAAGAAPTLGAIGSLAADDQQKAEILKIVAALDAIVKASDSQKNGLAKMLDEVRDKTRDLEKLLPNVVPAAEQSADDDDLPGTVATPDAEAHAEQAQPADASDPAKKAG